MVKDIMDSLGLIGEALMTFDDTTDHRGDPTSKTYKLIQLIQKIDRRLKVIEAEELGITLVQTADKYSNIRLTCWTYYDHAISCVRDAQ